MLQKTKSGLSPDPFQTDPTLYGTGRWSSGLQMGVLRLSQMRVHIFFAPKTNQINVSLQKNGNLDQRRIHSKLTRYSTERSIDLSRALNTRERGRFYGPLWGTPPRRQIVTFADANRHRKWPFL